MSVAVISSSLRPGSRSKVLARTAEKYLTSKGEKPEFIDLTEHSLPLCDGGAAYGSPIVRDLSTSLAKHERYLISTAIYNYDANSALKNMIELTGKDIWENKIVGFLCAAGGHSSYMSIMALANSLMLDFRCWIVPRFVYATPDLFDGEDIIGDGLEKRIEQLCDATMAVQIS